MIKHRSILLLVLMTSIHFSAATSGAPTQLPALPETLNLNVIRAIPAQHDGRWPPVDTVARDLVDSVTGTEFLRGHDPVLILLAMTFDAPSWRNAPIITINNAELRQELQLSPTRTAFSYTELTSHRPLHGLVDELSQMPEGQKPNPLQKKVSDIHGRLLSLQSIFLGRSFAFIPDAKDPLGAWKIIPAVTIASRGSTDPVVRSWSTVSDAFMAHDSDAFMVASRDFASLLATLPTAYRPSEQRIATELRYNRINPFRSAWKIMILATVLSLASTRVRRKWFDLIAAVGLVCGFAMLSYGLWMRWEVAGRIPASNMFESLLFLSWGMGAFAIVAMFIIPHRIVPLTASFMGAVALMLADLLPMNHFIRPIAPVLLDTVWMSIHVPIIMISYSVLALGVLIAHAQLVTMAVAPARKQLSQTIDSLHYWYIHVGSMLLLAGIVTGSMWAASSWGRYWGWDPKEVWSLVALLGYLTILHVRIDQERVPRWAYAVGIVLFACLLVIILIKLAPLTSGKVLSLMAATVVMALFIFGRGPFATALKSVLAFWLIIMTYVGVNYVLGIGLHSYGFGTGAVVRYMFRIGGINLALVGLCCIVYWIRRRRMATALMATAASS